MIGAGYTLAAVSPVVLGAARDASGSFHVSLFILVGVAAVLAVGLLGTILAAHRWMPPDPDAAHTC
jgi:cyanate permease